MQFQQVLLRRLLQQEYQGFNKILDVYEKKSPIKKNITTDDVAKASFTFLLSDYSNAITGQTIYVDNGFNIIGY